VGGVVATATVGAALDGAGAAGIAVAGELALADFIGAMVEQDMLVHENTMANKTANPETFNINKFLAAAVGSLEILNLCDQYFKKDWSRG
jgi:hypothetical protein